MKIRKAFIFFFLLVLVPIVWGTSILTAQAKISGVPPVIHFSKNDYEGGTQNWSICQGVNGLLYVGNNQGLLEFDGDSWKRFPLPNHTIVRSVLPDSTGRIFVGGQDEAGYFMGSKNRGLEFFSLKNQLPEGWRSFSDVWKIFAGDPGYYFCTREALFLWKEDVFEVIPWPTPYRNVFQVGKSIWMQGESGILFKLIGKNWEKVESLAPLSNSEIAAIFQDGTNNFLIFTGRNGLFEVNQKGEVSPVSFKSRILQEAVIYTVFKLRDGNFAIGTVADGLFLIAPSGKVLNHLEGKTILQNNTVLSLFQDQYSNLWLGLDQGVDFVMIQSPHGYIQDESGLDGTVYAIQLHKGWIYAGTNQGLYKARLGPGFSNGIPQNPDLSFSLVEGTEGQVWSLQVVDQDLYMGHHKGLFQLIDGKAISIPSPEGVWNFFVWKSDSLVAFSGTYDGLHFFRKSTSVANWTYAGKVDSFSISSRIVEQDNAGQLWIAHPYKGLFRLTFERTFPSLKKQFSYGALQNLPGSLSLHVSSIAGEMVVASPKGIFVYDPVTDSFMPHRKLEELLGKERNALWLREDAFSAIWYHVEDEFGVIQVKQNGLERQFVKKNYSNLVHELVDGFEHVFVQHADIAYLGTEQGIIALNLAGESVPSLTCPTRIGQVQLLPFEDSVVYYGVSGPFNKMDSIVFSKPFFPDQNSFRFSFSAPWFNGYKKMKYQYRLHGFDADWSEWTPRTFKEYTNLEPGAYYFQVRAKNEQGQIARPSSVYLVISPPWHRTLAAKILFSCLFIALVISFFRYYQRKGEREKEELRLNQRRELEVREALFQKEAQQSEAEIERLKTAQLVLDIKHKNSELASATMHLVKKTETLSNIKQELNRIVRKKEEDVRSTIKQIVKKIDQDIQLDENWDQFIIHFDQVHHQFFSRLNNRFPDLTPKDQKMCAYLRMNLSTKEIAPLMNISVRGVEISRYRLRKKLGIDTDVNLVEFILSI